MTTITIGTCGFPIARKVYFRQFPCIEVNITFYQLPGLATAGRWREEAAAANADFEFIVKAWQLITHPVNPVTYRRLRERLDPARKQCYGAFQDTPEVRRAWARTEEFCRELGARKVLFQTPPIFRPTAEHLEDLRKFFEGIRGSGFTCLFEPRGEGWNPGLLRPLCRALGLVHAVDPLHAESCWGQFRYYRLHGRHVGNRLEYDHSYSADELRRALARCDRKKNYLMFNNSFMYDNAITGIKMSRGLRWTQSRE